MCNCASCRAGRAVPGSGGGCERYATVRSDLDVLLHLPRSATVQRGRPCRPTGAAAILTFVDVDGLCLLPTRKEREDYATALGYSPSDWIKEGALRRLSVLASLAQTTDCMVITGPTGAPFWSIVSPTAFVRVEPDGYDYTARTSDITRWSYSAAGCSEQDIRFLLSNTPTLRHHLFSYYTKAQKLADQYREALKDTTPVVVKSTSVEILRDTNEQLTLLQGMNEFCALDFEWTIPDKRLIGINVSTADRNYYLPILGQGFDNGHYQQALRDATFGLARKKPTVWHNAKADINAQYSGDPLDLFGSPIEDTILMAYVAGEQSLGLKDLSLKLLGRKSPPLLPNLEEQPIELAGHYGAAGDSRNTFDLYQRLEQKLQSTEQYHVYKDIELPLVPIVSSMERFGSPLDIAEVARLREELWQKEEKIRANILHSHKLDFSNDQEQRAYLQANGFHSSSLSKDSLSRITAPWITPLLEYRETRTLRRNFLDKHLADWKEAGSPSLYAAYPTFNQAGRDTESGAWVNAPATGRFSSANPNFQNQPRAIRSCFVAPPGYKLVSLDYSALELRVAAAISKDPVMLKILLEGGDIHQYMRETIARYTGIDVGRPTAKTANFNLRYGGQADMLLTIAAKQGAHLSYDIASAIVEVDQKTYTGYWEWFNDCIKTSIQKGYSSTLSGRRRYNPDLTSQNQLQQDHASRAAANMVIQGTAADIIKQAMRSLVPLLVFYQAHLAIQVHDELVFWVPEDVANRFVIAAKGIMQSIPLPLLPLIVEGGAGDNWAEVH